MSDERPRLEVYLTRSVLFQSEKPPESFGEGAPSPQAKARLQRIKERLDAGYLANLIQACQMPAYMANPLEPQHAGLLSRLVDSVTSEVGRALVGLTVLQLCVKAIEPEQSVRLHKAGGVGSNFSWTEGIPMRVLDKNYITPILRHFDLLRLNLDGFMMTRSLAENYPSIARPIFSAWLRMQFRQFEPAYTHSSGLRTPSASFGRSLTIRPTRLGCSRLLFTHCFRCWPSKMCLAAS